jgi:single-strand DNA-binding protein
MSLNEAKLIGHVGRDPETRYLPSGDAVVNFSVATTDKWRDKTTNEQREATEWHRVTAFGKLAEIIDKHVRKGTQVYVSGKIVTRKWTDQSGVEKYSTEIKADTLQMLGGKPAGAEDGESYSRTKPADQPAPSGIAAMDDDIPF